MKRTLRQQFLEHVGQTSPAPLLVEVERAEGVFFYTPAGQRYFDLIAGVSVSNVGHANPAVVEAVQRQAARYMHVMVYGEMVEAPQVEYATLLAGHLPEPLSSVYFVNSGAEAVEGALKLAKRATGRRQIIAMRRAYHGSTHGALSVMSSPEGDEWRGAFEPLLSDVEWIEFNDLGDLAKITPRTACVLTEPVQGEGGVRLPEAGYLEALRARCSEVGALLVFDEIQTAMGRTGALFALQTYGVTPDILCLAKALGGGMPLGAFVASGELMSALSHNPALGHITTFGGHPVCCAAGLAALHYVLDNALAEAAEVKGALYEELLASHPAVVEVRRSGLLLAVELGSAAKMYRIMELFKERGILSDWFLFCDTAFRISPPLTISETEIRQSAAIILTCLDDLQNYELFVINH
ncbi:MAG: aspartate aminotransferase family protein [Rikenellaceae bacterium]|jgi:acetylornithine/succinyldiaminopimelate/putrescine aminotransferase|nr:aspartate aminotransferase family protein [Rikenellaceae bacterium]